MLVRRPVARPATRRPLRAAALSAVVGIVLLAGACSSSESATGPAENGTLPGGAPAPGFEPPPPRTFTVAGSGDILLHAPVQRQGLANGDGKSRYDFRPMFAEVRDRITAADLAICHMETPISADNTALAGYPIFNAPHEIADALADAGFDGCDTASNHSLDKGFAGVKATGAALEAAGLRHTGSFATAEAAADGGGIIYDVKGIEVGHLAFTFDTNGIPLPTEAPWAVNINDRDRMLAAARALKAKGAEVVIMSVHWGAEYQSEPTDAQVELANALLASPDVDLILGDHVHVVQPMAKIGDKYVIYGMGNFLSNQSPSADRSLLPATQDGAHFAFTFLERPGGGFRATSAEYTPTFVTRPAYVITPTSPTVQPESYGRTAKAVYLLGEGATDATPTTGPIPDGAVPPSTVPGTTPTTKGKATPTTKAPAPRTPTTRPPTTKARTSTTR